MTKLRPTYVDFDKLNRISEIVEGLSAWLSDNCNGDRRSDVTVAVFTTLARGLAEGSADNPDIYLEVASSLTLLTALWSRILDRNNDPERAELVNTITSTIVSWEVRDVTSVQDAFADLKGTALALASCAAAWEIAAVGIEAQGEGPEEPGEPESEIIH